MTKLQTSPASNPIGCDAGVETADERREGFAELAKRLGKTSPASNPSKEQLHSMYEHILQWSAHEYEGPMSRLFGEAHHEACEMAAWFVLTRQPVLAANNHERLVSALRQLLDDSREFHDTPDAEELRSGSHTNCGWCMAEAALAAAQEGE